MRKGFELFKSRKTGTIVPNYQEMADRYGITLPPIFMLFLENFEEIFFNLDLEKAHTITYLPVQSVDLTELFLYDFEESFKHSLAQNDDEFGKFKFISIGSSGIHSGGICLGTTGQYTDGIYVDSDYTPRFGKISENIFEFIRGVCEYDSQSELPLKYEKEHWL